MHVQMETLGKERATLLSDLRKTKDESAHLALVQKLEKQLEKHEAQRNAMQVSVHLICVFRLFV